MAAGGRVEGLDEVLRNLNRELEGIEERGLDGLYAAGLLIQGEAQKRTPVDTGNLRASAYTRRDPGGADTVEVGFTAAYAIYVHEAEPKHKGQPRRHGTRKGRSWETGEPKFLEKALRENQGKILDIVRSHARVDNNA